jgi:hypothetical protein
MFNIHELNILGTKTDGARPKFFLCLHVLKHLIRAVLIDHFLAQFRPSLTEVSHVAWCGVPLEMTGGTKRRRTKGLQLKGLGATRW